jgi:helicase
MAGARQLRRNERPVPLDEGILCHDGSFRYIDPDGKEKRHRNFVARVFGKGSSQDLIIPLARKLVEQSDQVIVFRPIRGEARGCAGYLARELGLPPAEETLAALPGGDPSKASQDLRDALAQGVAFHISDLERGERLAVEEGFRAPDSRLRVICATTTLAMGINTPAEAVIIAGLEHPGDPPQPYSVAEYKNMVGRAGRLGMAERGTSFLIALSANEEHVFWNRYVMGKPEDLFSRFAGTGTDPRSLIIRVLAAIQKTATGGLKSTDILAFLTSSFGAFQQMQKTPQWQWDEHGFTKALNDLQRHRLIEARPDGEYFLTALGKLGGEAGVEVESLIRIIEALQSTPAASITDPVLIAVTQLTEELTEISFPLNRKSTQKEPRAWPDELRRQGVPYPVMAFLNRWTQDSHGGTLRAKKAVACLLWITDTPMADIESTLTQFGGASGPVRSVATRTADLLATVAKAADLIHGGAAFSQRGSRLITRLQIGIAGASVELAVLLGDTIGRGD